MKQRFLHLVFLAGLFLGCSSTALNAQIKPDVLHYNLHLTATNFSNQSISGITEISFVPSPGSDSIVRFELWNLTVDSVIGNEIASYQYDGNHIDIHYENALALTDTFLVTIHYHGQPMADPTGWGGFRFMGEIAFNLGVGFGADPHNLGKSWFPCVDTFTDRASYDFYITTTENNRAVCGGSLQSIEVHPNDSGLRIHHWHHPENIPTYLASVAVGPYQVLHDTIQGVERPIPVELYLTSNLVAQAPGSFVHLEDALHAFEERYGPYRWQRIGYVNTPVGAMEHSCNTAYPDQLIDGTTASERTMAHELAHSWFGNLITANSAEDMWINEGWASFLETDFMEKVYGYDYAKEYNRKRHARNLLTLHHIDGDIPLYGIGHEHTYASTIYTKGADMAQTLKGYLGAELFYPTLKTILDNHAGEDVSVNDLKNYLEQETALELDPFFNAFIHQPGWLHFSIDSFVVQEVNPGFDVQVFVRQRTLRAPATLSKLRLPIAFVKPIPQEKNTNMPIDWQMEWFELNDSSGMQSFSLDFEPIDVILDPEEQIMDATTDTYLWLTPELGGGTFAEAYFKYEINPDSDSAWVRMEQNWIAPDGLQHEDPSLRISTSRYWKIQGWIPPGFSGKFMFNYNNYTSNNAHYDHEWYPFPSEADSLVLLYRSGPGNEWTVIPSERLGPSRNGYLSTGFTLTGEYTLAYRDRSLGRSEWIEHPSWKLYPNPTKDILHFHFDTEKTLSIELFDSMGRFVASYEKETGENLKSIHLSNLHPGRYWVKILNTEGFIGADSFLFFP